MRKYEKPNAIITDGTSEGDFAASGAGSAVSDSQTTGSVTGSVVRADHYGNYYIHFDSFENGAVYTITITVNETSTVNGLNAASWEGFGGSVAGNVVTFTGVTFANQTDQHIRLWFDSQGSWELGWKLTDADIPSLKINVTKVS